MELDRVIKCVIVGDGAVGKTCMLYSYATNSFPQSYVPTIFDNYAVNVIVNGNNYVLGLFDTAGQEDYDRLRSLAYYATDIFLLCFAVTNPSSFENIKEKWYPEVTHFNPNTPCILVGTQSDRRNDPSTLNYLAKLKQRPVPQETAIQFARGLHGCQGYCECSALTQHGLKDVFDEAILAFLNPKQEKKKKSCKFL